MEQKATVTKTIMYFNNVNKHKIKKDNMQSVSFIKHLAVIKPGVFLPGNILNRVDIK